MEKPAPLKMFRPQQFFRSVQTQEKPAPKIPPVVKPLKSKVPYDVTIPRTHFVRDPRALTKGRPTFFDCDSHVLKLTKAAQKLTPRQKSDLACSLAINALQHIGEETYAPARNFDSDSYIQSLAKETEKNLESVVAKHAEYKKTFSIRKSRNM